MSTAAKIVHLSSERRKVQSNKARKVREALMVERIGEDLSELDRLWADSAQLTEALTIGEPGQ